MSAFVAVCVATETGLLLSEVLSTLTNRLCIARNVVDLSAFALKRSLRACFGKEVCYLSDLSVIDVYQLPNH